MEGLQSRNEQVQRDNQSLRKENDTQAVILDILTNNGHDQEIIKRLRGGDTREEVADWLLRQPSLAKHLESIPMAQRHLDSVMAIVEQRDQGQSMDATKSMPNISTREYHQPHDQGKTVNSHHVNHWTDVTDNEDLVQHLLRLYFTWVHPVHMLFSEPDFMHSYTSEEHNYCSSPLVNVICGMACHLLVDFKPAEDNRQRSAMQLRDEFIDEAKHLLDPSVSTHMTSIQTLAVLYLADLSNGRARNATAYLRSAADSLRSHLWGQQSDAVTELSLWGIQTLNT